MSSIAQAWMKNSKLLQESMPDFQIGLQNLLAHKLRSLLTMLGMIFGVAAVITMMSIGAGARQQVMAFIEQMGVRNLIVEAKEAATWDDLRKVRKDSPGLTLQDYRVIRANTPDIVDGTPRKRFEPTRIIPKPSHEFPVVFGVSPHYQQITNLQLVKGRFFDDEEAQMAAPVAVLGSGARAALFSDREAPGQFVKVNEQWFRVIGIVAPQLTSQAKIEGASTADTNNIIYVPLAAAMLRLESNRSELKDEIDGMYLQLNSPERSIDIAERVRGVLNAAHRNTPDFSVVAPAELLAQQQRTQRMFDLVMVAIASISLLVGGIGIMNIMLANIMERTREIGVRRAIGARRRDVVRQFLVEAVLISLAGGLMGILFGFFLSRMIAVLAGWSTITTVSSILVSFLFSVSVGLVFGSYPAMKASRLDPVEAIRYE
jgi:putative ABC transport system permease protein